MDPFFLFVFEARKKFLLSKNNNNKKIYSGSSILPKTIIKINKVDPAHSVIIYMAIIEHFFTRNVK